MTPEERATEAIMLAAGPFTAPADQAVMMQTLPLPQLRQCIADAIRAAVAEEREACARMVDCSAGIRTGTSCRDPAGSPVIGKYATALIAAAIRARETLR